MASSKDLSPFTVPYFPKIFIKVQFRSKPQRPPKNTNLSNKVAIITGANTGLGFESARQLLSFQLSRLIIAVRSIANGEAAATRLQTKYPGAKIEVWPLDMASYDSIQSFVRRADTLARLDIAILNAGLGKFKYGSVPSTGHEEIIQVNYLSTALLAILLLPALKTKSPAGSPGRLSIVNSGLSHAAKFANSNASPLLPSFDDPNLFDPQEHYNISKTLAHMFIYKLIDYVSADDVIVNLVDPGFVKGTELAREVPRLQAAALSLFSTITARNVSDGASTYLDAVLLKGKESHGCYLMSWQIQPFAAILYTPDGKKTMERLWRETMDEFDFVDIQGILNSMKK